MHLLHFGNKHNKEVCCEFAFANIFNSLYLLVRLWWNIPVANLATHFQNLVAKVKNVVALAPVLGAISHPENDILRIPLTPISDQDRISPYSINTVSSRQVMRIKKNINKGNIGWSNTKFSKLTSRELYGRQ